MKSSSTTGLKDNVPGAARKGLNLSATVREVFSSVSNGIFLRQESESSSSELLQPVELTTDLNPLKDFCDTKPVPTRKLSAMACRKGGEVVPSKAVTWSRVLIAVGNQSEA